MSIKESEQTAVAAGASSAAEVIDFASERGVEMVDLKFFCGFSFVEIAAMRGVSERTVQRNWEKARVYLHHSIRPDLPL